MIGGDNERFHVRRDDVPHRGLRWAIRQRRRRSGPASRSKLHRTRFET